MIDIPQKPLEQATELASIGCEFKINCAFEKNPDCFCEKRAKDILAIGMAAGAEAAQANLESVLVGGNHLANVLIRKLGAGFSGLLKTDADADAVYAAIPDADTRDVWFCWAAIMRARTTKINVFPSL